MWISVDIRGVGPPKECGLSKVIRRSRPKAKRQEPKAKSPFFASVYAVCNGVYVTLHAHKLGLPFSARPVCLPWVPACCG